MKKHEHSIIAFILVFMFSLLSWQWFAAIGISAFWLGREHAQAEYRHIQAVGGKRENMPAFGGFYPVYWDKASFLYDLVLPVIVAVITAMIS
jgi:hypothetical protein